MGVTERQMAILKVLGKRRHETIGNLAMEFGVSARTIRRDIEEISLTEPVYTQPGRYGGGVYVMKEYSAIRNYFADTEIGVLKKLLLHADSQTVCRLSPQERGILGALISDHEKPHLERKEK